MRFHRGDSRRAPTRPLGRLLLYTALLVFTALLVACGNAPRVHLHICGDVHVPKDADALGVSLLDATRTPVYDGTQDLFTLDQTDGGTKVTDGGTGDGGSGGAGTDGGTCLSGTAHPLPLSLDLRDGHGDMWIQVQAFKQGAPVETVEARVHFPTQGAADVSLGVTRDCLGITCAFGQTCVAGTCQITAFGGTPPSCKGQPATGPVHPACEAQPGAGP